MSTARADIIDVHGHVFPPDLPVPPGFGTESRWPTLAPTSAERGRIMLGDAIFREVAASLWDVDMRIAEMDHAGIATQVVSPVPVTLTYWADPEDANRFTRALNDGIAIEVARSDGRLIGLGSVPLQDVAGAVAELRRIVVDLGFAGAEIGTTVAGRELDDPELRPFFAAAQELQAVLFIHPMDGGGGTIRRSGQPYDFGLGMLTDTALAAGALVFGGVLAEYPALRIVLAHGCGSFSWAYPRLRLMANSTAPDTDYDRLAALLWVDNLVFAEEHLSLIAARFGAEHIMVGTDYPFVPNQFAQSPALIERSEQRGLLTGAEARAILTTNAVQFFERRRV